MSLGERGGTTQSFEDAQRVIGQWKDDWLTTVRMTICEALVAKGEYHADASRGTRSGSGTASPCRAVAGISGEVNDQGGGGPSSHPAALPTLFEVEGPRPRSHYESEAA